MKEVITHNLIKVSIDLLPNQSELARFTAQISPRCHVQNQLSLFVLWQLLGSILTYRIQKAVICIIIILTHQYVTWAYHLER